ncbi:J domain-containing protein [uncultured Microscilla sp.]|uniref:J domain-containing protein n=1 Tax=uncultured Microscilla sp. TaxID=432653 RepID=UPI002608456A|nr:J domain-containing protein [uncultured Microscilla sp.]
MKLKNYYTLLQVMPQASIDEIKKAYRKLAKIWHPDKNHSPSASKVFQGIHEAYKTLTHPKKRNAYNLKYWQVFGKPTTQNTPTNKHQDGFDPNFSADSVLRKNCDRMMRGNHQKSNRIYQEWLNQFWANWGQKTNPTPSS